MCKPFATSLRCKSAKVARLLTLTVLSAVAVAVTCDDGWSQQRSVQRLHGITPASPEAKPPPEPNR